MASTYSNLKFQLMATGENSGTWGNVTNVNLGTAIEQALVETATVSVSGGDATLTLSDTNARQDARALRLNVTGASVARVVNVPAIEKPYLVNNAGSAAVTVKVSGQTGIAVPAGKTMWVYNDGTDVVDALTHLTSLTLGTDLAVTEGGTGASDASTARTNLGVAIGSNVQAWDANLDQLAGLAVTDGNFIVGNGSAWIAESGATARTSLGLGSVATENTVPVAKGGTGATDAGTARTNLGLAIGTNVQAYDAELVAIAALATTDGNFIVGNGSTWVAESGATARTSLGLGGLATLSAVGASEITDNSVGAAELNVSGNGTTAQFLRSDGDGSFTWATPTDTTYSAGSGLDLTGTTFSVETDLRDGITHVGLDSGDYIGFTNNTRIDFYVNGSNEFRMESDGDFHADGDVIAYSTTISDERLKENIVGIDGALSKVNQLNGYTFTYKADGKVSAGVIAQEVEKVLPEAVSEKLLPLKADDGQEYKVVNYDALHGLLIEAVKELTARVKELEAKVG